MPRRPVDELARRRRRVARLAAKRPADLRIEASRVPGALPIADIDALLELLDEHRDSGRR